MSDVPMTADRREDGRNWVVVLASVALVMTFAEYVVSSIVGGLGAVVLCLTPIIALAVWVGPLQWGLSPRYRAETWVALHDMRRHRTLGLLVLAFLVLFFLSLIQSVLRGTMDVVRGVQELAKWSSITCVVAWLFIRARATGDENLSLRVAYVVLALTATLNVLLLAAGIRNSVLQAELIGPPEPAVLLRLIGLDVNRVILPLGAGTRGIHSAAGLAIGFALFLFAPTRGTRILGGLGAAASGACLLLTDSRGGMLGAIGGMVAVILPAVALGRLRWLALAAPVLPMAMVAIGLLLQGGTILEQLTRPGESAVGFLSGRPLIWGSIAVFLSDFRLDHVLGYGQLGQVASGVNAAYGFLFESSYATTETAGAHNTLLQVILDMGYAGAIVVIAILWQLLTAAHEATKRTAGRHWGLAGIAGLCALIALGVTDSTLSVTNGNTLVLFLLLCGFGLSTGRGAKEI